MTKRRTDTEAAAGKLISAIQKEWGEELGYPVAEESEEVMGKGHDLLKGATANELRKILDGRTVSEYLGSSWVEKHPSVMPAIEALEAAIYREGL